MFPSMSAKADGLSRRGAGWVSGVGGLVDNVILRAMQRHADRHVPPELASVDRRAWMHEIIAFYERLGEAFYRQPPMPEILEQRREGLSDGGEVVDLAWPGANEPAFAAARDHYLAHAPNRRACARLFRHADRGRPAIVLLHGYQAGQFFVEERAFPVRWLYSLGLDVV